MASVKRDDRVLLKLECDDPSDSFIVRHTNQGDPYREGIKIGIVNQDFDKEVVVMLRDYEAQMLRDTLFKLYPDDKQKRIQDLEKKLQQVYKAGIGGIKHVGSANYESEALKVLQSVMYDDDK